MPELKEMKKLSVEMEKLPREISRFARLSNLSRREDSRHIFICPLAVVVMVMVVQRGNVFLLHESEREREREKERLKHGLIDDTQMTITVKTRGIR